MTQLKKTNVYLSVFFIFSLINYTYCQSYRIDPANISGSGVIEINQFNAKIDSIIKQEFKKIKQVSLPNSSVNLEIVDVGETKSLRKERKIIFNKGEFLKLDKSVSISLRLFMIQFIIAHELAHQVQFEYYEGTWNLEDKLILKMLLEAQADMLAGYYLGYLEIDKIMNSDSTRSILDSKTLISFYDKMLQLGVAEHTIGTHPSGNDRFISFFNGIFIRLLIDFTPILKKSLSIVRPDIIFTQDDLIAGRNLFFRLTKKIYNFNYREGNIIDWSFNMSKKTIGFDPEIAKNIILINKKKEDNNKMIKWNSSQEYPYVEYNLQYLNISTKKIFMETLISVNQELDNKIELDYSMNNKTYTDTIFPGETINIKGKLRWDANEIFLLDSISNFNKIETAKLIYPSSFNRSSLAYFAYVDDNENYDQSEKIIEFMQSKPTQEASVYFLGGRIKELVRKLNYSANDLFLGVGDYIHNHQDYSLSSIEYFCPISFDKNATVKTRFFLKDDHSISNLKSYIKNCQLEIKYDPIKDQNDALKKINQIEKAFDLSLLNLNPENQVTVNDSEWKKSNYKKNELSFINYINAKEKISISISIDTNNKAETHKIIIILKKI